MTTQTPYEQFLEIITNTPDRKKRYVTFNYVVDLLLVKDTPTPTDDLLITADMAQELRKYLLDHRQELLNFLHQKISQEITHYSEHQITNHDFLKKDFKRELSDRDKQLFNVLSYFEKLDLPFEVTNRIGHILHTMFQLKTIPEHSSIFPELFIEDVLNHLEGQGLPVETTDRIDRILSATLLAETDADSALLPELGIEEKKFLLKKIMQFELSLTGLEQFIINLTETEQRIIETESYMHLKPLKQGRKADSDITVLEEIAFLKEDQLKYNFSLTILEDFLNKFSKDNIFIPSIVEEYFTVSEVLKLQKEFDVGDEGDENSSIWSQLLGVIPYLLVFVFYMSVCYFLFEILLPELIRRF